MELQKIFEYALQREYEGKRFFDQNADRLSHAAAVGAFRQLAGEEQKHIDFIQGLLNKLSSGKIIDSQAGLELQNAGFFSRRALTESIDQTVLEAMVPDLPVLRMAFLIERDFAEFYEGAANKTDGEAKRILEMLAHWERGHESLFKEFHDKAYELYSQMPWGG